MPIEFKEEVPDPKAKKDPKQKVVRPVAIERKGPAPTPQQLESQVIPTLVRRVGDWKSGRISQAMCESYLDRHTLVFDRELLGKMFTEADYQKEGSLDARALAIAISGRFPKREHTTDWRTLTAMLLGISELVLTEDPDIAALRAVTHARPPGGGTYNAGNIWDAPPPPLPPVRRRTRSGRSTVGRVTEKEPSPEWLDTLTRMGAAGGLGGSSSGSAPGSLANTGSFGGMGLGGGLGGLTDLGASLRTGSGGGALDGMGLGGTGGGGGGGLGSGVVGTTGGLKQTTQIADEARLNAALVGAAASTFSTQREFYEFARGLEILPSLAADSGPAGLGPGSESARSRDPGSPLTATRLGEPKAPVRVWNAPLPPSAISLPSTALRTLRESVRSTTATKQDFVKSFKPLDSHELDLKKTLGAPVDVARSLARTEPVRDTKVLPNADYVQWCDYAANCRTGPTGWYNKHPAAVAQDSGDHKYPWC
ncbi:hypothetical protein HYH03_006772 [Edaphochlamys debaryana]|uniref:Uncharacterized protein n=1 Tax=Edaphochlamys debaryana TaxID=47281 RepID=A0A835Y377_9CHLO|nr:hypothetical protein HYH03_006772 [Edaphochlamys debaryana]|eukprot:KAG2495165.1 hypothetical protein HYH03_006772 [Edaphochlamys debaryana]